VAQKIAWTERVGSYRIRFHDHGDTIEILTVKHRSEANR
jgi:hypothetical protein